MSPEPEPTPIALDLADFDALGVATGLVDAVRSNAIERELDVAATVSAPDGWHRVVVTGRRSGHLVLSLRYGELTPSRWHNVAGAIAKRSWDLDDDSDGATCRFPPGTEASAAAFELLAVLVIGGAPADVRHATALDAAGNPIPLGS